MKQWVKDQLERKQAEIKETENMAEKPEVQTQDPELKALLQLLLEDKAEEVKARQKKENEAREQTLATIQSQIEAAKEQNERNKMRRDQCDGTGGPPHQTLNPANGNKRSAWRGQVNSDGTFSPVCCKCLMVMPKIRATDEQKKEGVNLGGYVELSVSALERWHKGSYPDGCDQKTCYLCYPVKEEVGELVTA
jgi:hypothetical protein